MQQDKNCNGTTNCSFRCLIAKRSVLQTSWFVAIRRIELLQPAQHSPPTKEKKEKVFRSSLDENGEDKTFDLQHVEITITNAYSLRFTFNGQMR